MYKLLNNLQGIASGVKIEKDGFVISIPFDPDNTDYQAYLKWVAEGNTPQAADAGSAPANEQGA